MRASRRHHARVLEGDPPAPPRRFVLFERQTDPVVLFPGLELLWRRPPWHPGGTWKPGISFVHGLLDLVKATRWTADQPSAEGHDYRIELPLVVNLAFGHRRPRAEALAVAPRVLEAEAARAVTVRRRGRPPRPRCVSRPDVRRALRRVRQRVLGRQAGAVPAEAHVDRLARRLRRVVPDGVHAVAQRHGQIARAAHAQLGAHVGGVVADVVAVETKKNARCPPEDVRPISTRSVSSGFQSRSRTTSKPRLATTWAAWSRSAR